MDHIDIRSVSAMRYKLSLDESIYCDLLEQLKAAEAKAREIHTKQGKEVADAISKAIGLACLTEFRKTCKEVKQPTPPHRPTSVLPFPCVRVEGSRLTVELAEYPNGDPA